MGEAQNACSVNIGYLISNSIEREKGELNKWMHSHPFIAESLYGILNLMIYVKENTLITFLDKKGKRILLLF